MTSGCPSLVKSPGEKTAEQMPQPSPIWRVSPQPPAPFVVHIHRVPSAVRRYSSAG
jgi:hypothetical protein